MVVKEIITCGKCGYKIVLFDGDKMLENSRCRMCGGQLEIPAEYVVSLNRKNVDRGNQVLVL